MINKSTQYYFAPEEVYDDMQIKLRKYEETNYDWIFLLGIYMISFIIAIFFL